jgi:membrane-bound lytic murein transglycosylase B
VYIGRRAALEAARDRLGRVTRTPAFGLAVITPLVLALAVGASAPQQSAPVSDAAFMPLAAVAPTPGDPHSGPAVVAVSEPPIAFHFAAANISAPPPAVVVNSPGAMRIPAIALSAYRNAERMMAGAYPACGVSWNLLAGIGRIESMHANGGATDARGTALQPIYGPALDGTLPGNEVVLLSTQGGRVQYARAMGPMQFLPGTWAHYASDGKGDGTADPQNLFDSTLAAARYLCSGGLNLRDPSQVMTAILRYNNSVAYAQNVLGWAAAYATGVIPVNLPPIIGPIPALGDAHLDAPEGLGPGMPLDATGLPPDDPLARPPVVAPGPPTEVANQLPTDVANQLPTDVANQLPTGQPNQLPTGQPNQLPTGQPEATPPVSAQPPANNPCPLVCAAQRGRVPAPAVSPGPPPAPVG